MIAARSVVEEAGLSAVELVEAVEDILGGVRVHHVEEHDETVAVRRVDQLLQLLRVSVAAANANAIDQTAGRRRRSSFHSPGRRVKVGHLVAETGVVDVLHDGHELYGVVT